jgi:alanine dehydrogenase
MPMDLTSTLILTRSRVAELLGIEECISAVEAAFRMHGQGATQPPGILGIHAAGGGFHIKAGIMGLERPYFVAKTNANFPNNRERGLPTIQGIILVFDAVNGRPLAVMDSIELTIIRTGAATAVAAKYLSRKDSTSMLICGCGDQGRISLEAILTVRNIERVFAYDIDHNRAERFADSQSGKLGIKITAVKDISGVASGCAICVTCTPARDYFLTRDHISPGTFVAAVGADSEDKHELEPQLLSNAKVVVDILDQSATIGELHHAIEADCITRDDVHSELGEIVAGLKPGRTSEDEIIIFDSTGMALQDVAAASIVYERALASPGERLVFND